MHDFKTIVNLVADQFPDFYRDNGPMFMQFVLAYYEWLEQDGNVLDLTHKLHTFRDIDETLDQFLGFFEKEYLFGIPAQIKGDKRFLVKHVLDVYRAKGTIEGYKLLFRLLYNDDIDVYLPQTDMLKPSDGTWYAPAYLEVTSNPINASFVGKRIKGSASGSEAIVEDYVVQFVNGRIVEMLFIGSVSGNFQQGEKIVDINDYGSVAVLNAPTIVGSVVNMQIIDGGINFNIGDILIAVDGQGRELEFRVAATANGAGSLFFYLENGGTYYTMDAVSIITRPDHVGDSGHFNIGSLSSVQTITYDGNMLLSTNMGQTLNSGNYNIGGTTSASSSTQLSDAISFTTKDFGSIGSLTNVVTGQNYNFQPTIDVKDFLYSANLAGTVTFSNSSTTMTGVGTSFTTDFSSGNTYVRLQIVNGANTYYDHRKVISIANNTSLTLDDYVNVNTAVTGTAYTRAYELCNVIFDRSTIGQGGNNAIIRVSAQYGSGVVSAVTVKNSGIGYNDGETVSFMTSGAISNVTIVIPGTNYKNNQSLVFAGGSPVTPAAGYIRTYANGSIANVTMTSVGSGYQTQPAVKIISATGTGGQITCGITGLSNAVIVKGALEKAGQGVSKGRFTSTKGFLNADKYITDSYYYQDFSYEIQAPVAFESYVDIIKRVFHPAGVQPFGKVVQRDLVASSKAITSEVIGQGIAAPVINIGLGGVQSGQTQVGSLQFRSDVSRSINGVAATGSVGSVPGVLVVQNRSPALTPVSATISLGAITTSANSIAYAGPTITGQSATVDLDFTANTFYVNGAYASVYEVLRDAGNGNTFSLTSSGLATNSQMNFVLTGMANTLATQTGTHVIEFVSTTANNATDGMIFYTGSDTNTDSGVTTYRYANSMVYTTTGTANAATIASSTNKWAWTTKETQNVTYRLATAIASNNQSVRVSWNGPDANLSHYNANVGVNVVDGFYEKTYTNLELPRTQVGLGGTANTNTNATPFTGFIRRYQYYPYAAHGWELQQVAVPGTGSVTPAPNLVLEDMTTWSPLSTTSVTAQTITGPKGAPVTAYNLAVANGAPNPNLYTCSYHIDASNTPDNYYVFSAFVKPNGANIIYLKTDHTGGNDCFDLNPTASNGYSNDWETPSRTVMKPLGNGWYFIAVSVVLTTMPSGLTFTMGMTNRWLNIEMSGQSVGQGMYILKPYVASGIIDQVSQGDFYVP